MIELAELRETLLWYARAVENCRKISSDGDNARNALHQDGGRLARTALTNLTKQGYAVVPLEPTEAMLEEGAIQFQWTDVDTSQIANAYRAMIRAAEEGK